METKVVRNDGDWEGLQRPPPKSSSTKRHEATLLCRLVSSIQTNSKEAKIAEYLHRIADANQLFLMGYTLTLGKGCSERHYLYESALLLLCLKDSLTKLFLDVGADVNLHNIYNE